MRATPNSRPIRDGARAFVEASDDRIDVVALMVLTEAAAVTVTVDAPVGFARTDDSIPAGVTKTGDRMAVYPFTEQ